MKELSLFEQFLYEAPGDDPPPDSAPDTTPAEDTGGAPPDMPDEAPAEDDSPPDMGDDFGGDDMNDAPPEMGGEDDGGFEDFGTQHRATGVSHNGHLGLHSFLLV